VLSNGIPRGSRQSIPAGGHCAPNSTVGDKLLWNKAQKNDPKNNASDKINRTIPYFNIIFTVKVCFPKNKPSLMTSLNHTPIPNKRMINVTHKVVKPPATPWKNNTPPVVKANSANPLSKGHGES